MGSLYPASDPGEMEDDPRAAEDGTVGGDPRESQATGWRSPRLDPREAPRGSRIEATWGPCVDSVHEWGRAASGTGVHEEIRRVF